MENSEVQYTREHMFSLLLALYPDAYQDEKGYIDFSGETDRKDVANDLAYGSSQLTKFLNPHEVGSYTNIIKRLEQVKELKDLRLLVEDRDNALKEKEAELSQLSSLVQSKARIIYAGIFILLISLLTFFILLNRAWSKDVPQIENQNIQSKVVTIYQPFYQPTREQLDTFLDWHFHHLNYWVASEVLVFYANWKQGNYKPENFDYEYSELRNRVIDIILKSRDRLEKLNIMAPDSTNFAKILEDSYDEDIALAQTFESYKKTVKDADIGYGDMRTRIVEKSREVQNMGVDNILKNWDSSLKDQKQGASK